MTGMGIGLGCESVEVVGDGATALAVGREASDAEKDNEIAGIDGDADKSCDALKYPDGSEVPEISDTYPDCSRGRGAGGTSRLG